MAQQHNQGGSANQPGAAAQGLADAARAVAQTAGDQARQATRTAGDVAQEATRTARDAARAADDQTNGGISALAGGMRDLAGSLRGSGPQGGVLGDLGSGLADTLERGSTYLQGDHLTAMADDLGSAIRRNPLPAVLLGVGVGFLLGRIMRS